LALERNLHKAKEEQTLAICIDPIGESISIFEKIDGEWSMLSSSQIAILLHQTYVSEYLNIATYNSAIQVVSHCPSPSSSLLLSYCKHNKIRVVDGHGHSSGFNAPPASKTTMKVDLEEFKFGLRI